MRSTFMGLEASKRGLFTQQSALYTTGHNISNANTEGYSRQRVNMEPTLGYPGIGLDQPKTAGFIGTGVQAHSVQRIRDEFIDRQYRQETNKLGYWESRSNAISQMEDIVNEPSEYGLDKAFDLFWQSLEDVSANPENSSSRKVAISRGEHLAESFNYIDTQLKQIQGNLGNEINVSTTQINSIVRQIADINRQVMAVEPNGYMPNDLYDARDVLIDRLNEYLPVTIERVPSGGNALDIAEGSLTVKFKGIELVNGRDYASVTTLDTAGNAVDGNQLDADGKYIPFASLEISGIGTTTGGGSFTEADFEASKGKFLSLIDSYGYSNGGTTQGYYPETLAKLDQLANVFIDAFNELHKNGFTLAQGTTASTNGGAFFTGAGAQGIQVNSAIINDPSLLAASSKQGEEGNGKWAIELGNLQTKSIGGSTFDVTVDAVTTTITLTNPTGATVPHLNGATFQSYYQAAIGKIGVDGQESNKLKTNSETLRLTVENNRSSMSSVSLDEEMTNLVTFQQAYNANARMITVVDETLDKIINGMGRVGI